MHAFYCSDKQIIVSGDNLFVSVILAPRDIIKVAMTEILQ